MFSKSLFHKLCFIFVLNINNIKMLEKELEIEFEAYQNIKKFVNRDSLLFKVTKIENGYELKNKDLYYQVVEHENNWWFIVINDDKEYRFNCNVSTAPFNGQRDYDGGNHILNERVIADYEE